MKKILVDIEKDYISFSLSANDNNKIGITKDRKLVLTKEMFLKNIGTISHGINNLCNRAKIEKVIIQVWSLPLSL